MERYFVPHPLKMKNRNHRKLIVSTENEKPRSDKIQPHEAIIPSFPAEVFTSEVLTFCMAQGLPFQAQDLFCGKPNSPFAKFAMGVRL